ncbi:MAG: hypothetical protein QG608_2890 [Actinomycetota bacterium]|nr:hypothetical protein [Actinomycetota bacterium]
MLSTGSRNRARGASQRVSRVRTLLGLGTAALASLFISVLPQHAALADAALADTDREPTTCWMLENIEGTHLGESLFIHVTVAGPGGQVPDGQVILRLDGRQLGLFTLENGRVGTSVHGLPVGSYPFDAEYLGTDRYAPCKASGGDRISRAYSFIDLWAVPNGTFSDRVTVRLRSPYRSPEGQVTLSRFGRPIGTASLDSRHTATFTVSQQPLTGTLLEVRFRGSKNHQDASLTADLPRHRTTPDRMAFRTSEEVLYWDTPGFAVVTAEGLLPPHSSLEVVEISPRPPDSKGIERMSCPEARWCFVSLDPRVGPRSFQARHVAFDRTVLRRSETRVVHWSY